MPPDFERPGGSGAEALAGRAGAGGVRALFSYALQREPTELEREQLEGHALRHGLPAAARIVLNLAEFQYVD